MVERGVPTGQVDVYLTNVRGAATAVIAQLTPAKAKVGWWKRLLGNGA